MPFTFTYDDRLKLGRYKREDEWYNPTLEGGTFNNNTQVGYFPITHENVMYLMKRYWNNKSFIYKLSILEEFEKAIKAHLAEPGIMALLQMSLAKAKTMPILYKPVNGNPQPFANQVVGQYWNKYKESHAMLWEMGTGKTRGSIEGFELKRKAKLVDHGLVVCPVSMIDKWVDEIEKWSGEKSAIGIKGSADEKFNILKENWVWYVVSFETLLNMIDDFAQIVNDRWFVVADEFTKIKNPSAKRSKALLTIGRLTTHKNILSGTPVTQHAYDLFTPFLFLDGGKTFGLKYDQFLDKYFWRQGYKYIPKYDALEKIGSLMYNNATRFLKKDCIDIPEKLYDQRYLELPPYNRQRYDEMVKFCITQIEGSERVTAFVILTQLLRLSQITSGFVKDEFNREVAFEENPKINALQEILEENNGNHQIVIWSRFIHDTHAIANLCKKLNITHTFLTGETKPDERTRNIADFQSGKAQIIIGTAGTGGHGIDLVAGTICIYYSNSYSLEQRLQSEDRLHRAGQKNQVTYIDLLCKNTVDVAIYKILRNKKEIADIVTKDNLRQLF